jgi:hypothetical protein
LSKPKEHTESFVTDVLHPASFSTNVLEAKIASVPVLILAAEENAKSAPNNKRPARNILAGLLFIYSQ